VGKRIVGIQHSARLASTILEHLCRTQLESYASLNHQQVSVWPKWWPSLSLEQNNQSDWFARRLIERAHHHRADHRRQGITLAVALSLYKCQILGKFGKGRSRTLGLAGAITDVLVVIGAVVVPSVATRELTYRASSFLARQSSNLPCSAGIDC